VVFKTTAIVHSAIPPKGGKAYFSRGIIESQLRNAAACGRMERRYLFAKRNE
jgi:hypothetical protein